MDVDSVSSSKSGKSRVAEELARKTNIQDVLERKKKLASTLKIRSFFRKSGTSLSTNASLGSMEVELTAFERSIGKEILATTSSSSFHSVGRKSGQNNTMESRDIHLKSSKCWSDDEETSSIDGEESSNPTLGDKSAKTRKISNLLTDVPEMEELDNDSSCLSVSDGYNDDESRDSQIEYEENNPDIDTSGSFLWYDRFVREGDLCIDYVCQIIDCDPRNMYMQTKTPLDNTSHPQAVGGIECSESEESGKGGGTAEEKLPEGRAPKKKRKMSWFSLTKSTSQIIELKSADPALDDLTDSDSWTSDSQDEDCSDDSDDGDENLLSSSPELYFESIQKSSNREGDANDDEEEVGRILHNGRVMCEV